MDCIRCKGLMITDRYLGLDGQLAMLRCANCGAVVDARIQHHQHERQRTASQQSRARHSFPHLSRMTFSFLHSE
jgi:hypothetical protein